MNGKDIAKRQELEFPGRVPAFYHHLDNYTRICPQVLHDYGATLTEDRIPKFYPPSLSRTAQRPNNTTAAASGFWPWGY